MSIHGADLNLQSVRGTVRQDLSQLGKRKMYELYCLPEASMQDSQDEDVSFEEEIAGQTQTRTTRQSASSQTSSANTTSADADTQRTEFYNTNKAALEYSIEKVAALRENIANEIAKLTEELSADSKANLTENATYQELVYQDKKYMQQQNLFLAQLSTLDNLFGTYQAGENQDKKLNSAKRNLLNDLCYDHSDEVDRLNTYASIKVELENELIEIAQKRLSCAYQAGVLAQEASSQDELNKNKDYQALANQDKQLEQQQKEAEQSLQALSKEIDTYINKINSTLDNISGATMNITSTYLDKKNELETQLLNIQLKIYDLVEESSNFATSLPSDPEAVIADMPEYQNILAKEKEYMAQQAAIEKEISKLNAEMAKNAEITQTKNSTTKQTNNSTTQQTNDTTTQIIKNTRITPSQKSSAKKKSTTVIFNNSYNQKAQANRAAANAEEDGELFPGSKNTSNKSWQNIIDDLDSKVDYDSVANGKKANETKDMTYKELSAYYASKMDEKVLSAGKLYYTEGKGSMFRYPAVEMPQNTTTT